MSWWVYLRDEGGQAVEVERHSEGGTYAVGGIAEAELNVTYNYGRWFRQALPELSENSILATMLHGRCAGDTLLTLERVVVDCGTERDEDYWASTPGNAGYAASILLAWAHEHPDAVWEVC